MYFRIGYCLVCGICLFLYYIRIDLLFAPLALTRFLSALLQGRSIINSSNNNSNKKINKKWISVSPCSAIKINNILVSFFGPWPEPQDHNGLAVVFGLRPEDILIIRGVTNAKSVRNFGVTLYASSSSTSSSSSSNVGNNSNSKEAERDHHRDTIPSISGNDIILNEDGRTYEIMVSAIKPQDNSNVKNWMCSYGAKRVAIVMRNYLPKSGALIHFPEITLLRSKNDNNNNNSNNSNNERNATTSTVVYDSLTVVAGPHTNALANNRIFPILSTLLLSVALGGFNFYEMYYVFGLSFLLMKYITARVIAKREKNVVDTAVSSLGEDDIVKPTDTDELKRNRVVNRLTIEPTAAQGYNPRNNYQVFLYDCRSSASSASSASKDVINNVLLTGKLPRAKHSNRSSASEYDCDYVSLVLYNQQGLPWDRFLYDETIDLNDKESRSFEVLLTPSADFAALPSTVAKYGNNVICVQGLESGMGIFRILDPQDASTVTKRFPLSIKLVPTNVVTKKTE